MALIRKKLIFLYPETLDPATRQALETLHDGASAHYKSERSAKRRASLGTTPVNDTSKYQNPKSESIFSPTKKEPKRVSVCESREGLKRARREGERRAEYIESGRQVRRSLRYKHRAVAAEVLGGMGFKIEGCGKHSRLGGNVPLKIDGGQAYFDGVVTCGSLSICPQCAAKITMQRQSINAEVLGRVAAHREDGKARYTILFITHTVRHKAKHSFEDVWGALHSIYRATYSGNPWKLARERFGYIGGFRVIETTHGRSGWHVHSHAVVVVDNFEASKSPEEMAEWVTNRWYDQSKKHRGYKVLLERGTDVQILRLPDVSPDEEQDARLIQEAKMLATYMHKSGHAYLDREEDDPVYGEKESLDDGELLELVNPKAHALSMEALGAVFKKGRAKNRTAFEILADIAKFQEIFRGKPAPMRMRKKNLRDREIFREYAMGTKGKRLYQTMGDYKALALALGVNVDKLGASDEELAEQEKNGGGQVLAELPREVWCKVREPRLAPVVLNVAEKVDHNPYELYGLLVGLGLPDRYMLPLIQICEDLNESDLEPVGDTPADVEELGQLQLPVAL